MRDYKKPRNKKIIPNDYKLKQPIIPDGMVVKIDTREQNPLWLPKPPKDLVLTRGTLANGDYSIVGFEDRFAVERKKDDLWVYLTSDRENTKEKLVRLKNYEFKALVIEYEEEDLYIPKLYCNINPEVVRMSLVSFEIRYGLHVFYGGRDALERKVLDWMVYYWKIKHEA